MPQQVAQVQPPMMNREYICAAYLEFVNDYLTVEKWAEHRGLNIGEAETLVSLMRQVYYGFHPEE
jgi:hypothetical protein